MSKAKLSRIHKNASSKSYERPTPVRVRYRYGVYIGVNQGKWTRVWEGGKWSDPMTLYILGPATLDQITREGVDLTTYAP